MDFSTAQKLKSSAVSSVIPDKQSFQEQRYASIKVTFERALVLVNNLVFATRGRYLTEPEILVLRGTWNHREFVEIAENSPYSVNYLQRGVACRLWDVLSKIIGNGERVNKKNLRYLLEKFAENHCPTSSLDQKQSVPISNSLQIIGSQPPDVSNFYGRTKELSILKELIIKQRCIALVGVAGIGKSALAAKLLGEYILASEPIFDYLIWKSVSHTPPIEDLLDDVIQLIQPSDTQISLPKSSQGIITEFIKNLQSHRCLIVLDASEALFQRNNLEHRLEYRTFFQRLVEEQHQSCLLLTSRFLPDEINNLVAFDRPVQSLKIEGLDPEAATQFLSGQGLNNSEECKKLINTYRGNPLELKAALNRIYHFFPSAKIFFENPTTFVSDQFQEMLNQIFSKDILNELERYIMIFLAEESTLSLKCVTFGDLLIGIKNNYKVYVSTSELIAALEVLEKYSLIESCKDPVTKELNFSLQPVIKKYIKTDPLGLVRASDALPTLANAS